MSKHTPWRFESHIEYPSLGRVVDANGNDVSPVAALSVPGEVATARLIAAAPEMLEALEAANAWFIGAAPIDPVDPCEGLNRQSLYERIAKVIAKAEGRS